MPRLLSSYLLAGCVALAVIAFVPAVFAAPGDPDRFGGTQRNPQHEARVDPSAATTTLHYLWCPGVASTSLVSAGYLEGAKALMIHNKSSATCYVGFEGSNLVSTAVNGDEYAAGDKQSQDISGSTFGPWMRAVCTAVLSSPNCLKLRWWK